MKTTTKWASLALFLLAAACAGSAARAEALLPAMRQAWAGIRECVVRELTAAPSANGAAALVGADVALNTGDPLGVAAADWQTLDALAEGDIQRRSAAGLIGPGIAESLRERLRQFATSRATFTRSN